MGFLLLLFFVVVFLFGFLCSFFFLSLTNINSSIVVSVYVIISFLISHWD